MKHFLALILAIVCIPAISNGMIVNGQIDDFEDGTTMNWVEGNSPNPPTNAPTGGPAGANDNYMENVSSGLVDVSGGKMTMFNQTQWSGDYIAAGVDKVSAQMANLGQVPLFMRVAIQDTMGQRYVSSSSITLPADGQWYSLMFNLDGASMTQLTGTDPLSVALANVNQFRIVSAQTPIFNGDIVEATIGVDNIQALPEPTTAMLMALGGLIAITHRRRRA